MALRASGRFSVTVATLSATSTFRHSYLAYLDTLTSLVFVIGFDRPTPSGACPAAHRRARHEATPRPDPAPASAARHPDGSASAAWPWRRFARVAPSGIAAAFQR